MSNTVKIVKGEKLPDFSKSAREKYPWHEMEVGDYFVASGGRGAYTLILGANQSHPPKKFKARQANGEMRIWRVE